MVSRKQSYQNTVKNAGEQQGIYVFAANGKVPDVKVFIRDLQQLAEEYDVVIQGVNADMVYSKTHLLSAGLHALRAWETDTASTNSLEMEVLLYAAGERQIKLAIPKMGINSGAVHLAFVILDTKDTVTKKGKKHVSGFIDSLCSKFDLKKNDKLLEGTVDILTRFGITKTEMQTVPKAKYEQLILEKIALVDIIK